MIHLLLNLLALIEIEVPGEHIRAAVELTDNVIPAERRQRSTRRLAGEPILMPRAVGP